MTSIPGSSEAPISKADASIGTGAQRAEPDETVQALVESYETIKEMKAARDAVAAAAAAYVMPAKVDGGVLLEAPVKVSSPELATLASKWLNVDPKAFIGSPSQLVEIKQLAASVLSQYPGETK